MCVTVLLWITIDTGVVGGHATAKITTKSYFSTLGRRDIFSRMIYSEFLEPWKAQTKDGNCKGRRSEHVGSCFSIE